MLVTVFIFALLTVIFFWVIGKNKALTRTHGKGTPEFDGNGYYQYKGRGDKGEPPEILLSRIDWLAKNSGSPLSLYTVSFILAYCITLCVTFILYAGSQYLVNYWELCLIFMASFIVAFSISNLFSFHTDRYPQFYIRKIIKDLGDRYGLKIEEPPDPVDEKVLKNLAFRGDPLSTKIPLPHRTELQDVLAL